MKILVIGSSNTDMVIKADRLPAPGETVLGGRFEIFAGGKGANQAVAASRAGGAVTLLAAVGEDDLGRQTIENLTREGIDTTLIKVVPAVASGVALIMVGPDGDNMIAVASGANAQLLPEDVERVDFSRFTYVVLQLEIPLGTVAAAVRRAKAAGCTILLNPAPAAALADDLLAGIDLLLPNRGELELLAQCPVGAEDDVARAARRLQAKGVKKIVVTLGARGAVYFDGPAPPQPVAARPAAAVDTVGAGDCFTGTLATALSQGLTMTDALGFATAAASLSVQQPGAQPSFPRREQICRVLP